MFKFLMKVCLFYFIIIKIIYNYLISKKRDLILRRIKKLKFRKSKGKYVTKSLLPAHLKLEQNPLKGFVVANLKRKNICVRINELKVIEYYNSK